MLKKTIAWALLASVAVAFSAHAADAGDLPSDEELDAMAMEVMKEAFHDKGIIKVDKIIDSMDDELIKVCTRSKVYDEDIDKDTLERLQQAQMDTIEWPEDDNYIGDWEAGEAVAQSGRGGTWSDKADDPYGGGCYNCHKISSEELSFGTIGPSLYNYGKIRGVEDPWDPADHKAQEIVKYTWGKIYNAKGSHLCSQMPRFGAQEILTQDQIRDLMALLLDPESPVNE